MSNFMLYAVLFKFVVAAILLIIQKLKNTNNHASTKQKTALYFWNRIQANS